MPAHVLKLHRVLIPGNLCSDTAEEDSDYLLCTEEEADIVFEIKQNYAQSPQLPSGGARISAQVCITEKYYGF